MSTTPPARPPGEQHTLPTALDATGALPQSRPSDSRLDPGTTLAGRFEIVSWLGEGGAGAVYSARDRLLGEEVALKVLHRRPQDDSEQLARLRAEVRAARRIAHPSVCRVHDLVESGALVFVVMELLRGETLRRRLRRTLGFQEAIEIARELGAGLAAASGERHPL